MQKLLELGKKIYIFLQLKWVYKALLIEAILFTGIIRFIVKFLPFSQLKRFIGKYSEESTNHISEKEYSLIAKIKWSVIAASKNTPWESECLVQAVAVQKMLRKRNINSTLYLGIGKGQNQKIMAHAWLKCGSTTVTGGNMYNFFKEVAKFY